eukprot:scaffold43079_cov20-Tisochrysis_lutea.AAC.3
MLVDRAPKQNCLGVLVAFVGGALLAQSISTSALSSVFAHTRITSPTQTPTSTHTPTQTAAGRAYPRLPPYAAIPACCMLRALLCAH